MGGGERKAGQCAGGTCACPWERRAAECSAGCADWEALLHGEAGGEEGEWGGRGGGSRSGGGRAGGGRGDEGEGGKEEVSVTLVVAAVNAERPRHYTAGDALCLMSYVLCLMPDDLDAGGGGCYCGETETLYGR